VRFRLVAAVATAAAMCLLAGCQHGGQPNLETVDTGTEEQMTPTASALSPTSGASSTTSPSTINLEPTTASPSPAPPSTGSSNDDDLSAQERSDRAAVEAQWIRSWDIYLELPGTPQDQRQALAATAMVDPALSGALKDASAVNDKGWDTYGDIEHRISWPKAVNGGDTALVDDCMDTSNSGSFETSTGNKTTVGTARLHVQGNLIRSADGNWLVAQNYFLKDEPC